MCLSGKGRQADQPPGCVIAPDGLLGGEEAELQLDLRVPASDDRKPLSFGGWIRRPGDELMGFPFEQTGKNCHRSLAGHVESGFQVRDGRPADAEAVGQLLLGPAQLTSERGDPPAK